MDQELHEAAAGELSGVLRFDVMVDERPVTAFLTSESWQASHGDANADLRSIYQAHRPLIEQAVQRKVKSGARQPVVLRSNDL
jgi:hypothetical protein